MVHQGKEDTGNVTNSVQWDWMSEKWSQRTSILKMQNVSSVVPVLMKARRKC